ncbi:hypothetical protein QOZ80_4BG0341770 [Eleusine coracana subsp. coracana]|nr:hypothetical protein QOZ80_4BG0341770 [Eleusine coracana subsp. coracana]
MINITYHTIIEKCPGTPPEIPLYYFRLARLQDVPSLVGETKFFVDVIGQITAINELELVTLQYQTEPTERRIVTLRDLKYNEVQIHIWGQRAVEFDADEVCSMSEATPVVAIFVGLLAKPHKGGNCLSGNTACRWYLNPDIPESHMLLNSLKKDQKVVPLISITPAEVVTREARVEPQKRSLVEIINTNPYDFPREGFRCTVTLARYNANQSWWFPSCNRCSKSCVRDGNGYKCAHDQCTGYKMKYKLCYFVTDGRAEIEVVFFDEMGRRLLGKDVRQLIRASRNSGPVPSDIAAQVGQRYQLTINVTSRAFQSSNYSYEVRRIDCAYGRQPVIPAIDLPEQPVVPALHLVEHHVDTTGQSIGGPGPSSSATRLLQDDQNMTTPSHRSRSVLEHQSQIIDIVTPPPPITPVEMHVPDILKSDGEPLDGLKETAVRRLVFKDAVINDNTEANEVDTTLEDSQHDSFNGYGSDSDKRRRTTTKKSAACKKPKKN